MFILCSVDIDTLFNINDINLFALLSGIFVVKVYRSTSFFLLFNKNFWPSARENCRKDLLFNMVLSVKEMSSLRPYVIFGVSRFLYTILLPFYPGSLRLCV